MSAVTKPVTQHSTQSSPWSLGERLNVSGWFWRPPMLASGRRHSPMLTERSVQSSAAAVLKLALRMSSSLGSTCN